VAHGENNLGGEVLREGRREGGRKGGRKGGRESEKSRTCTERPPINPLIVARMISRARY